MIVNVKDRHVVTLALLMCYNVNHEMLCESTRNTTLRVKVLMNHKRFSVSKLVKFVITIKLSYLEASVNANVFILKVNYTVQVSTSGIRLQRLTEYSNVINIIIQTSYLSNSGIFFIFIKISDTSVFTSSFLLASIPFPRT